MPNDSLHRVLHRALQRVRAVDVNSFLPNTRTPHTTGSRNRQATARALADCPDAR